MASNILFVFEGAKTEKLITDNIKKNLFNDENVIIQCAFCTTIYNLYKKISQDEDLDTFEILKNIPHNAENLSSFNRNDFAEIYMFFDYDGHTTSASDKKLIKLLDFFNEETEFGKLFISYPMVEALKHCHDKIDFKELKVEAKKEIKYKKKVNRECDKDFINMPLYDLKIWLHLIDLHLKKMNYIVDDNFIFPTKNFSQNDIFFKQLEKYINIDSTVAVLSAFPIFLFDYYGNEYISKLFSQHE
ncbi:hypothetical protein [Flavobacterium sharifuzzamanii]|uniref:hypothetical protein n=1 Tax=Flavobacterium sharifuzzamanii TaxID=2211133 RepID=UPI000DABC20D|nr:hypothetical protein [Flavobacterium sharifuzzamanii]KAF2079123.1 hypothetical protein DMA14_21835 [Flavobacterium sharifuzzamanii]